MNHPVHHKLILKCELFWFRLFDVTPVYHVYNTFCNKLADSACLPVQEGVFFNSYLSELSTVTPNFFFVRMIYLNKTKRQDVHLNFFYLNIFRLPIKSGLNHPISVKEYNSNKYKLYLNFVFYHLLMQ